MAATQGHWLQDLQPPEASLGIGEADRAQTQDDVEDIERLVDLTFRALLRRKPDRDTLLAYREGFANGTTFHDLIDDVLRSDEYRSARQRIRQRRTAPALAHEATVDHEAGTDLPTMVALLTRRLVEKGWQPQNRTMLEADRGGGDRDARRMRSLRVTLSVLDRL